MSHETWQEHRLWSLNLFETSSRQPHFTCKIIDDLLSCFVGQPVWRRFFENLINRHTHYTTHPINSIHLKTLSFAFIVLLPEVGFNCDKFFSGGTSIRRCGWGCGRGLGCGCGICSKGLIFGRISATVVLNWTWRGFFRSEKGWNNFFENLTFYNSRKQLRLHFYLNYPRHPWVSTKNFSPIGLAVWPAIGNIYTNVLFYYCNYCFC